ncbi:hypothetical protein E4U26_006398 [Claviceps purpurea]|nr:hypothetical protein E4U26_006398 [Claviceps purpurea]
MADYNAVEKGKCAQEFLKLKDCYLLFRSFDIYQILSGPVKYAMGINSSDSSDRRQERYLLNSPASLLTSTRSSFSPVLE